jgi:hypothetical protein
LNVTECSVDAGPVLAVNCPVSQLPTLLVACAVGKVKISVATAAVVLTAKPVDSLRVFMKLPLVGGQAVERFCLQSWSRHDGG